MTQPETTQVDVNDVIDELANMNANQARQIAILSARLKAALGTPESDPVPADTDKASDSAPL